MKRKRRATKRVVNTGQGGFGFCSGAAAEGAERQPIGDDRFQDDDPYSLCIADKRLDVHLREIGMGWVVTLRQAVSSLDYTILTSSYSSRGRRAFHPRTVLGLILYGLFVRQMRLRDLERLSATDIGAWWICGGHRIDHSTIGKFIQMHEQALGEEFFKAVVTWVVGQLHVRPGVASIDGTVIESAGSHWKAIQAEALRMAADEAKQAASAEPNDAELEQAAAQAAALAAVAQERCAKRERQGKKSDSVAVVPSDPEAVIQPRKDGVMRPGYKASTLMHEAGVIIAQDVHPSSETAPVLGLLDRHSEALGDRPGTLLIDAGYHNGPLLRELSEREIDVLCPSGKAMGEDDWEKKGRGGLFAKTQFRYDRERDVYVCPAGQELRGAAKEKDANGRRLQHYRTPACQGCELRERCTSSKHGRTIKRYDGDEYKEAMAVVLTQPRARQLYRRRMGIAEPVHAEFRERLGLRRFARRGLAAVRAEFALYCIAFNLKKVLMAASAARVSAVLRPLWRLWAATVAPCAVHFAPEAVPAA